MYLLVTNFDKHWNELEDGKTSYRNSMISLDPADLKNNTKSVFIRIDAAQRVVKGWKGRVEGIKKGDTHTSFSVRLDAELKPDECEAYKGHKSGWYLLPDNQDGAVSRKDERLLPQFYQTLATTSDWREFEDLTYKFIRLLGVHTAYQISTEKE